MVLNINNLGIMWFSNKARKKGFYSKNKFQKSMHLISLMTMHGPLNVRITADQLHTFL